jgi:hypothetical protein
MSIGISNDARLLQNHRPFPHGLPRYTEHVGNQLLRHDEFGTGQSIQAQQEPATKLLLQRMMFIASRPNRRHAHVTRP